MVANQPGYSTVRTILFSSVFIVFSLAVVAQKHGQAKVDSLSARLVSTGEDTNRVKLLIAIAGEYEQFYPQKGMPVAKQSLRLAKKLASQKFEARALRVTGLNYFRRSDLDSAFTCMTNALDLFRKLGDSAGVSTLYGDLGMVYHYKMENLKALDCQERALKIAESLKDSTLIAKHFGGIGYAYFMLEKRVLSLEFLTKSLRAYERLNNQRGIGTETWMIGLVYRYNGDYGKAIEHFYRAIKILEKQDAKIGVANCYISLGEAYADRGETEKAMQYFGMALRIKKEVGNPAEIGRCLASMAGVYTQQGDLKKGLDFYKQGMAILDTAVDAFGVAMVAGGMGNLYADMRMYDEAKYYYKLTMRASEKTKNIAYRATNSINLSTVYVEQEKQALEKSDSSGSRSDKGRRTFLKDAILYSSLGVNLALEGKNSFLVMYGSEVLTDAYELSGNYKEALVSHKRYSQYKDSIFNKTTTDKIARAEVKFEYDKKQLADSLKTLEVRKLSALEVEAQRNYMWGGGGFAALILVLSVASVRKSRTLSLEKLRNKISRDLHDEVGSTLSSVSLMNELTKQGNAEDDTREQISIRLQSAQDAMSEIVWLLNPKNDLLDNFIHRMVEVATEMLQFKSIQYKLNIPDNFSGRNMSMDKRREIYLVFKECLNNIIKYSGCTHVEIEVTHTDRLLILSVADNGRGFNKEETGSGNGLRNMRERAATLKGTLTITTAPGSGARIVLAVPLSESLSEKWAMQVSELSSLVRFRF